MDVRDLSAMTVAFMLASGLFEVPWGWLGDRFGARNLLVADRPRRARPTTAGARGWSYCLPPVAIRCSSAFLLALRFLFGMFQAGTFPVPLAIDRRSWMPTTERRAWRGVHLDVQQGASK